MNVCINRSKSHWIKGLINALNVKVYRNGSSLADCHIGVRSGMLVGDHVPERLPGCTRDVLRVYYMCEIHTLSLSSIIHLPMQRPLKKVVPVLT